MDNISNGNRLTIDYVRSKLLCGINDGDANYSLYNYISPSELLIANGRGRIFKLILRWIFNNKEKIRQSPIGGLALNVKNRMVRRALVKQHYKGSYMR